MNAEMKIAIDAQAIAYNDYARWTEETAQYPKIHEAHYLALGLSEETGEMLEAIDMSGPSDVIHEAGDIFWYAARYSTLVLGTPFDVVVEASKALGYSIIGPRMVMKAIAIICGVEKKRVRDGELWSDIKKRDKNAQSFAALIQVLAYVIHCISERNTTVIECLVMNQNKLSKRKEAGVIRGDGDHR
jgi:NTP pyrophosphatase (non-canonical NTP hydrolase)